MKKILNKKDLTNEIAVVVGTRPGIIKFSPVIRALDKSGHPFFIIHTGQHYSYNMDKAFFDDLNLPKPRYHNSKASNERLHGTQTAIMIIEVEKALLDSKPGIVIVGGDANTNLAGALATRKLGIKLAHMEAGLRSNDWRMPEEHNRVMIDHISEILFPPTELAKENLISDNVKGKIYVVGNPIVDAVYQNSEIAINRSRIMDDLSLQKNTFILVTLHREENLDHEENLLNIVESIKKISEKVEMTIVIPIHPRTAKTLKKIRVYKDIENITNVEIVPPVGYIDFLNLLQNCRIVLTDSGGIQEEACILKKPCVTLRDNTERPETVQVGANKIAGTEFTNIMNAIQEMMNKNYDWKNPFGDGKAGQRIVERLIEYCK